MATRRSPLFSIVILLVFLSFLSFSTHFSIASDIISPGQSLSGDQTIFSKGGNFELGFFKPGNSHNYYIGIWYRKVSEQTVVWVANREKPVSNASSSELKLSGDGNLVLTQSKLQFWSTNLTLAPRSSTVAVLLDTGNLVLKDVLNSHVLWQSFDYPTNTWLPGAKVGYNKFTGVNQFLTSWRNSEDPATGMFSVEIDPNGISQFYILWNRTRQYWTTGVWDGHMFSLVPEMRSNYVFNFTYVANVNVNYFTYAYRDSSVISSFILDSAGQMKRRQWANDTQQWVLFCAEPRDPCEVYSVCGSFGSCSNYSSPSCRCLQGFEQRSVKKWNLGDTTGGCVRKTPLQCGHNGSVSGKKDGFMMIPDMQLPINPEILPVSSMEECELTCLNNCSCTAYSYDSVCSIWNADLLNLKKLYEGSQKGSSLGVLYLRLAASELLISRGKKQRISLVFEGELVGVAALVVIVLVLFWRLSRRQKFGTSESGEGFLIPFHYKVLQRATKNFSEKLGCGSFGSVFKGKLPDSTMIAVKRLEGLTQGEKQFRMEVSTLGMIQHVNLVRLHGFCSEGIKRLLVYDYVSNGSLDSYLFQGNYKILEWNRRYQIAVGIARGLAYLHEQCRECIIHCDIKPENILLDKDLCPKVADFGMAKLVGREFSRVLTTMRGTIGYLAPEWISGSAITPKADVYSFGMMLFEIISGRRNVGKSEDMTTVFFPVWAARKLNEGDVLCLLDQKLEGEVNIEELSRACRIACWCVQDDETDRPTMGNVVQLLEGFLDVGMPSIPRFLQRIADNMESIASNGESIISKSTEFYSCNSQA